MTKPSIAGAIPNPSIVLLTGKATLPIKAGQANAFKAKAGEHYGNLKKKDAEEQLLDNVVAKPTGEDGKPLDAEGTGLTLQSAFIQAPVAGSAAAIEAAMPGQLAQGYQPSAQGGAGASLSEGNNLGGQVFAYAGADALLLAQAETGITAGAAASAAATPDLDSANIVPLLGFLGIVGLGIGVAAAAGGNSAPATVTPTVDTTAPTAVLSAATDNVGSVTGVVASGGVTDDTVLVLSGTNEASATVNVYNGLTLLGAATISGTTWSYNATVANATTYTFNAKETDVAGNVSAATTNYTITGDTTAPTVASVAISSATNSQNSTLNAGDVVSVTVTMSEATTVVTSGGTPTLALVIGATTVQAAYASGSGSTTQVFTYTVLAGQTDTNGISIAANSLALNGGTLLDAAGNAATLTHALVADNAGYLVDTTAPTVTNTSGAYTASTDILVLTGTNYNTLLETSEDATTDIKARLDWSKLSWDINGDNATTTDVSFALSDISSALVTDSTNLTIVLAGAKGTSLEATSGYGGATLDTLDITAGFAKDAAGNAATTDAQDNGTLAVSAFVAGDAVIDLGAYGKLIAPVEVEGAWYYYWDRSGDGTNNGTDRTTHNVLDGIFTSTLYEVLIGTTGTGTDTTDDVRYANLNGVKVALPTANGGVAYPQDINAYQNGTSYTDADASTNGTTGTFNELLAIWDAYNGTGTGTNINGTPSGWQANSYWSATPLASGHAIVYLNPGYVGNNLDPYDYYVALQVLSWTLILV